MEYLVPVSCQKAQTMPICFFLMKTKNLFPVRTRRRSPRWRRPAAQVGRAPAALTLALHLGLRLRGAAYTTWTPVSAGVRAPVRGHIEVGVGFFLESAHVNRWLLVPGRSHRCRRCARDVNLRRRTYQ
jgi:hypothetical protein